MFSCILLSAGESVRFGSPKALARLNGRTVIEHLQQTLLSSLIDEVLIVLGARAEEIKPFLLKHEKVRFVYNKHYKLGQTSSFQAGLRECSAGVKGLLLLPIDYPFLRAQTIDLLIRSFQDQKPLLLIPTYVDRKGHPPVFHPVLKDELLDLEAGAGINAVIHRHAQKVSLLPVPDRGVVETFNTPEEFRRLKGIFHLNSGV